MKPSTYIKLTILLTIIIVAYSGYQILTLQDEVKRLRAENDDLIDPGQCVDYLSNNENLVVMDTDSLPGVCEDFCK